jgi:hypothetical protein
MAIDQKKLQKKLAKKKAKRKAALSAKKKDASFLEKFSSQTKAIVVASKSPIEECLIGEEIFYKGIGTGIIARKMPDNYIGAGVFLLDVWCLGVKNAYLTVLRENEYVRRVEEMEINEGLANIHPSCLKKIIEGCVEFSGQLGFKPHPEYKITQHMLAGIDSTVCPNNYTFGKNGKPFYASGPYDTEQKIQMILNTLLKNCGEGNYDYLVSPGGFDFEE